MNRQPERMGYPVDEKKKPNRKSKPFSIRKYLKGWLWHTSVYYQHLAKQDRKGKTVEEIQALRLKAYRHSLRSVAR